MATTAAGIWEAVFPVTNPFIWAASILAKGMDTPLPTFQRTGRSPASTNNDQATGMGTRRRGTSGITRASGGQNRPE
ncbi:MAG: hypothetical protein WC124_05265 [Desulfoplanes sp.]